MWKNLIYALCVACGLAGGIALAQIRPEPRVTEILVGAHGYLLLKDDSGAWRAKSPYGVETAIPAGSSLEKILELALKLEKKPAPMPWKH